MPVYHIDLSVGVTHVADDGPVLHAVQLVSGHHVFVPYRYTPSSSSPEIRSRMTRLKGSVS